MASSTALTVVDQVEQHPAVVALEQQASAMAEVLGSDVAVRRFRRSFVMALMREPKLRECTPDSLLRACFEIAAWGWEIGQRGAWIASFNTNVGTKQNPRYEKLAQVIPDYRGVADKVLEEPTRVASIDYDVVKEGDEFTYRRGTDPYINHDPALDAQRSRRPTTHAYAVAHMRGDQKPKFVVLDRAKLEQLRAMADRRGPSPAWRDWFDEQAQSKVVKQLCKLLPIRPEIARLVERMDELEGETEGPTPTALVAAPPERRRTRQLAARLRGSDVVDGESREDPAAAPAPGGPAAKPPEAAPEGAKAEPATQRASTEATQPGRCGNASPYGDGATCALASGHAGLHRQLDADGHGLSSWDAGAGGSGAAQ